MKHKKCNNRVRKIWEGITGNVYFCKQCKERLSDDEVIQ